MTPYKSTHILQEILKNKKQEVFAQEQKQSLSDIKEKIITLPKPKDFLGAIKQQLDNNKPAVIAEIKKASPSKGIIRQDFDPVEIAAAYQQAGATCLSVLTDEKFFQGSLNDLIAVRHTTELPILRKDFIIDDYQIYQARLAGADCILLIVAALDDHTLKQFTQLAKELGLAILVEVHNKNELQRALKLETSLIGINNRDLHTFKTSIQTTLDLISDIPAGKIIVSESGIDSREDIQLLRSHQVHSFLIGETLMRAEDPRKKFKELFL